MNSFVQPIRETALPNEMLGTRSYDCVFFDVTENKNENIQRNINRIIIEKGLAEYDPETNHFIDITFIPFDSKTNDTNEENCETESIEENWDHSNYVRPAKPIKENIMSNDDEILDFDIQFTNEDIIEAVSIVFAINNL